MMWLLAVVSCAFLFNSQPGEAVKCLQCVDMPHPFDCNVVTECTSSELCYVEQFITSSGITLYNSGCLSKQRCNAGKRDLEHRVAKRQSEVSKQDLATCIQCCQGEYCNIEGCRDLAVPRPNRGPKCFSCPAELTPDKCRDTVNCDYDQVCAVLHRHPFEKEWESKCMGRIQCHALVQYQASLLVGKRNVVSVKECPRCCEDDFCNDACQHNVTYSLTTTAQTNPTTIQTSPTTTTHTNPPTARPPTTTQTKSPTTQTKSHNSHSTTPLQTQTVNVKTTTKTHSNHNTTPKPVHSVNTSTTTKKQNVHSIVTTPVHHTKTTAKTTPVHHTKPTTKTTHVHHTKPTTKTTPVHHTKPTTKTTHVHRTKTTTKTTHINHTKTTTKTHTTKTAAPPTTTPHLVTTTDPSVHCTDQGYIYDTPTRMCLRFVQNKLNWTEAQDECNKHNGRLVVMTSPGKIKDVNDYLQNHNQYHGISFWVGATEISHVHTFTWTDGHTIVVDDSKNYDLTKTNCLLTGSPVPKVVYDPCPTRNSYICENSNYIRP